MNKIYGITTCGSVRKAISFFKSNEIEFEFVDLKKVEVGEARLDKWLEKQPMSILFNTKGTKFKTLGLDKNMSEDEKKSWLLKEQLLFKRPIVEFGDKVVVGFDEMVYQGLLINSNEV